MARCTAKNRRGEQCRHAAINGTSKCRFHGGASLVGIASPSFKTGRYSKHLPTRLAARYGEALADPDLLHLRDEVGLIGTRIGELVERIDSGESAQRWKALQAAYTDLQDATRSGDKPAFVAAMASLGHAIEAGGQDYQTWREIVELAEARRKLAESERKRLVEMQQMISSERAMILLAAITDVVRRNVSDPSTLAAISADLRQLTVIDAGE